MTWQDIATAPKDGTRVLAVTWPGNIEVVAFNGGGGWVTVPGKWACTPTHFMALPDPPTDPERAERTHDAIIAMVRAGTPIKDCGIPRTIAYQIVRRHEAQTGERLPRSRATKFAGSVLPEAYRGLRNSEIIEAYRALPNMRPVGERFGITAERVRQIVVAHEKRTGETLPRGHKNKGRQGLRAARVVWQCADCGDHRELTVKQAEKKGPRCSSCEITRHRRFNETQVEAFIAQRKAGIPWETIGSSVWGHSAPGAAAALVVYNLLQKRGDTKTVALLWPKGPPPSMIKRLPGGRRSPPKPERATPEQAA